MESLHVALGVVSLLLSSLPGIHGGEFCPKRQGTWSWTSQYCSAGCCGDGPDYDCCPDFIGLAVGCTIAGIILISVIVAVVCCLMKKKGHVGRVVQPLNPTPAATVFHTTNTNYQMQPMGAPPPAYTAVTYSAPVPAYGAPAPVYGTPAPAYGTPAPAYGTPAPAYGTPAPAYGTPAPAFGAPGVQPYPDPGYTSNMPAPPPYNSVDSSYPPGTAPPPPPSHPPQPPPPDAPAQ